MTKTKIIEAAYKVLAREFYTNTSLSLVARELKVCKPALYRHFLSKNALFEAMTEYFFEDFAAFIRADYEKALKNEDSNERIFILIRKIAEYYSRKVNIFIFSMIKLRDRKLESFKTMRKLRERGIDFQYFQQSIKNDYTFQPLIMRLIFSTLTFFIGYFHKTRKVLIKHEEISLEDTIISNIINAISEIIGKGLNFTGEEIDSLDYDELESRICGTIDGTEHDPLLKAVAGAVAEAGPWEASMEQVARRSGLSKSSLYCHFKNKQDMLHQLFMTESMRIIDFARRGMEKSTVPCEQLYLGIFSIVEYLRSRPDILTVFDWIRNRKLFFHHKGKKHHEEMTESLQIFDEINIGRMPGSAGKQVSPWIFFLIVNTLMIRGGHQLFGDVSNNNIRFLYRFLTMGIGGFEKSEKGEVRSEKLGVRS